MKIKITLMIVIAVFLSWANVHGAASVSTILNMADKAYAEQRYDAAAKYYQFVLKLERRNPSLCAYVKYRLGRVQLIQGKSAEALTNMEEFYSQKPDDPFVVHDYAQALFYNKKYKEAIPVFEKAASLNENFATESSYYIGASKIALGEISEGAKILVKIKETDPQSAAAKSADRLLANLEKTLREAAGMEKLAAVVAVPGRPTKEKPWAFSLSLGVEYDSNVGLIPSQQTRPQDISNTGDLRAVHSLAGVYEFLNTGKDFAGVKASVYGTSQLHDTMFNVENTLLGLYYKHNMADTFQLRVSPFISRTWLNAASQSWFWGVSPGVSWQPVGWTWTDLDYAYAKVTFLNSPLYQQEDRSGNNNNVSLKQNFSFQSLLVNKKNTYFGVWLNYGKSNTDGSSYDNDSRSIGLQVQQELPQNFTMLFSYAFGKVYFENPNIRSATYEKRNDTGQTLAVNVFKKLDMISKHLSAYAGWRWYNNSSNIDQYYSYCSNTYSMGLMLDY
jgi:hypothetical protein